MDINRITYSIKPSFADESFCEIEKKPRSTSFSIFVKDRNGQRQIQTPEECILPILDAVKQLCLPIPNDVSGLDGTTYELTFGITNSVTYSWWMSLPKEWAALEKIILAIEAISGITKQDLEGGVYVE